VPKHIHLVLKVLLVRTKCHVFVLLAASSLLQRPRLSLRTFCPALLTRRFRRPDLCFTARGCYTGQIRYGGASAVTDRQTVSIHLFCIHCRSLYIHTPHTPAHNKSFVWTSSIHVRFQVLMVTSVKITVLRDVASCCGVTLPTFYRRFLPPSFNFLLMEAANTSET
jgi:hypothetical protein